MLQVILSCLSCLSTSAGSIFSSTYTEQNFMWKTIISVDDQIILLYCFFFPDNTQYSSIHGVVWLWVWGPGWRQLGKQYTIIVGTWCLLNKQDISQFWKSVGDGCGQLCFDSIMNFNQYGLYHKTGESPGWEFKPPYHNLLYINKNQNLCINNKA